MTQAQKIKPIRTNFEVVTEATKPSEENFVRLSNDEYLALLRNLVQQGAPATKNSNIIAFPLPVMNIATLNNRGTLETAKDFEFGNHLVFDAELYSLKNAQDAFRKAFTGYSQGFHRLCGMHNFGFA